MNLALSETELPVRLRFERPMTDDELMRFCAENELLRVERDANGELIVMSPTGTEGGNTELDVATELNLWARQDGRGKTLGPNSGVTLPDGSVRAADTAWVSWERWNALTHDQQKRFAPICPEFVIEIRSEHDRLPQLQEKMWLWLDNGAELGWLVDPSRKTVEVYRPGAAHADILEGVTAVYGEGSVGGFILELSRIWG
jgi:Uma2 family endonuclease